MMKFNIYRKVGKRAFDVFASSTLIVVLSPVLISTALILRKQNGKPVIYKVKRPGKNGEVFTMYKFRSMTNEKDEKGELLPDHMRITPVGRFIRKTSIDELPELFNIMKGDMSFVGPRPLSVKYLPYYNKYEMRRHDVKPGLTGLAQINGRNTVSWEERFDYDIQYVENYSFIMDIFILFKTLIITLKRDGIVDRGTGKVQDFHIERIDALKGQTL